MLRRRRRRNRSTETLTYAADGCWDGSQSTLSRCARHAAGFVLCLLLHRNALMHIGVESVTRLTDDGLEPLHSADNCTGKWLKGFNNNKSTRELNQNGMFRISYL